MRRETLRGHNKSPNWILFCVLCASSAIRLITLSELIDHFSRSGWRPQGVLQNRFHWSKINCFVAFSARLRSSIEIICCLLSAMRPSAADKPLSIECQAIKELYPFRRLGAVVVVIIYCCFGAALKGEITNIGSRCWERRSFFAAFSRNSFLFSHLVLCIKQIFILVTLIDDVHYGKLLFSSRGTAQNQ